MCMILSRRSVYVVPALLLAFATGAFEREAQATIAVLTYGATVDGGTFLSSPSEPGGVTAAPDRLSFSVAGDYSLVADGTSSTVTVTITTNLLTPDIQGSFVLNTSIAGSFAYIPTSPAGTIPELTIYSATSTLQNITGSATVTLPGSPVPLSTAPDFPTGGLELSGSQTSVVTLPAGMVYQGYLEQVTTITFNNVSAGETLQIQLPDNTSLTPAPVPEPGSLTPMLAGVAAIAAVCWRKYRRFASRSGLQRVSAKG